MGKMIRMKRKQQAELWDWDVSGTQTHSQLACGMEHSIDVGAIVCVSSYLLKKKIKPDTGIPIAPEYSHIPSIYYTFFQTGTLW